MTQIWKPSAVQILTLMVFWGQIQNYMMRTNLSILIVEMVSNNVSSDSIQKKDDMNIEFQTCNFEKTTS